MEKLAPLGNNVIVKPIAAEEVRKSGLIIPETAQEKPQEGEIIAIGPGKTTKTGNLLPMSVKVGDRVIFAKYTGSEMKIDGEKYLIMPESDILAIRPECAALKGEGEKVKWLNKLLLVKMPANISRSGVDTLADAVKVTLGPRGRNVVLESHFGAPTSTHDGNTVAKEIELKDRYVNMGSSIIKEAAKKTADEVGDGSTTSTILAQAIIIEGFKNIAAGAESLSLKYGLEKATAAVIAELKKMAKPVKTKEDMTRVATVTSHDSAIGEIIGDIMDKVGKDGVITVEEGKGHHSGS